MSSVINDQFEKDKAALMGPNGDLATAEAEATAYKASVDAYKQGWENIMQHADPMKAYIYLFLMMAGQGMDELTGKTATDAGSLQIQGDLTKLGNDMEKMTTENKDVSYHLVNHLAAHSDEMIQLLDNSSIKTILDGKGQTTGPTTQLSSQYLIIRQMIYDPSDPSDPIPGNNPAPNPAIDPPPSPDTYVRTYYFDESQNIDPNNASQDDSMNSFGQLHDGLGLRSDPYQSNEAEKKLTNAFNENTSTTQSTNAASQEIVSNDQNNSKGVQSFVVAGLHSMTDVDSAAIKAATKSS